MNKMGIKPGDIIIFSLALITVFGSYIIINSGFSGLKKNQKLMLNVSAPGGEWIYPLDKSMEIGVEGPLGTTIVHIDNGKAWISAVSYTHLTLPTKA